MSTYQILKSGTAITGALTYVEALQKSNDFKRADVANMSDYDVDIFMPNRQVSTVEDVTNEEENMNSRIEALAAHLNITPDAEIEGETLEDLIEESSYTPNEYEAEGNTYLVLTDEEADEAAREYIETSLWAFNADFLAGNTGLPAEVFSSLQEASYEDSNETILTLVTKCGNLERLVSDAIASDGRGHFLASYDGNEEEEGDYFIYRTN